MSSKLDDPAVRHYLGKLNGYLLVLPDTQRLEIVRNIEEHIRTELSCQVPVDQVLAKLGSPQKVAQAAGVESGNDQPPPHDSMLYLTGTTVLLLFGGFLAGAGWLFGVILLWLSKSRTLTEKIIAITALFAVPIIIQMGLLARTAHRIRQQHR